MEERPPTDAAAIRRLITELESREMETVSLTRIIRSATTPPQRLVEAIERRDEVQEQWVSIVVQLDALGHNGRSH